MDKLQLRETILKQIERPDIPDREFPACLFGVVPDSGAVQTLSLIHIFGRTQDPARRQKDTGGVRGGGG